MTPSNPEAKKIEAHAGDWLENVIAQVVRNHPAYTIFNGILLESKSNEPIEADVMIDFYHAELDRLAEERANSVEGQAAARDREAEIRKHTATIADGYQWLKNLRFDNHSAILRFFELVSPALDHLGVTGREDFGRAILTTFKAHGMVPSMNTGSDFNKEDKDNFALYIIGQCLSGIEFVGAPHPIVTQFISSWRDKFKS